MFDFRLIKTIDRLQEPTSLYILTGIYSLQVVSYNI